MRFTYRPPDPAAVAMRMIEFQIEGLREYADLVSSGFKGALVKMNREAKKLPTAQRAEYFDWYYDRLVMARDEGPQIMNGTLLVSMYTVLERGLIGFCQIGQTRKQSTKQFKKAGQESHIGAARRYLKQDLHFRILDGREWRRIDRIRYIRNCLVHDMGRVTNRTSKPTLLAVRNTPGVTRNELGYLAVDDAAVGQFADDIVAYCTRVAEGISR